MKKKLFDPQCPVGRTTTGIVNGHSSGSINLNGISYQWAYNLWEQMLNNTWFTKEVDMTADADQYKLLLPTERRGYDKALSQLIFMDGLQTNNTPDNVNGWVTAPEVNMTLVRQSFEEALHSQAYAVMVDSISANTSEIYEMWRTDKLLYEKNELIFKTYEKYGALAEDDDEAKIYMIAANQILEGIYFYSGFSFFYVLARAGKMLGSAQMIRFIQRDELTHLSLFRNMFNTMKRENSAIFTDEVEENVRQMIREGVELEIKWGKHIISGGILGLTDELIEGFIKFLGNERAKAMKLGVLYPDNTETNLPWFNDFSSFNDIKTNFFEGNNANYSKGVDMSDF